MDSIKLENVKGTKPRDFCNCRGASGIGSKHRYTIDNNLKRFFSEFSAVITRV